MAEDHRTCPSCGARVPTERDRCELCGTVVDAPSGEEGGMGERSGEEHTDARKNADRSPSTGGETVFCNQCGWENPPGAKYCSQCGEKLQEIESSPGNARPVSADLPSGDDETSTQESEPSESSPDQGELGRQIAFVIGGALFVILIFFGVTRWSSQYEWSEESADEAPAQATPQRGGASGGANGQRSMSGGGQNGQSLEPMDLQTLLEQTGDSVGGTMAQEIDSLRSLVEQASGSKERQLQGELVNLLIGAGYPGRAAVVQQEIADATGTADSRRRAADLLYRWMQKFQRQNQREQVVQVARHVAKAYEAVVEQRPNDLDARTRMGEAYLLTNNPMRGIQAINGVLEDDSTFVPARFQKGLALLQINRLDQAAQQFEKIKTFADDTSPFYKQADRALRLIEQQQGASSSTSSSSGSSGRP